jgi:hypothetical protein
MIWLQRRKPTTQGVQVVRKRWVPAPRYVLPGLQQLISDWRCFSGRLPAAQYI